MLTMSYGEAGLELSRLTARGCGQLSYGFPHRHVSCQGLTKDTSMAPHLRRMGFAAGSQESSADSRCRHDSQW